MWVGLQPDAFPYDPANPVGLKAHPQDPARGQLLGDRLEVVRRTEQGWEVTFAVKPGYVLTVTDVDLECAYAQALLTL